MGAEDEGLGEDLSAEMLKEAVSKEGYQWDASGQRPPRGIWGGFSRVGVAGGGSQVAGPAQGI